MTADELVTVFATRDVLEADMVRLELQYLFEIGRVSVKPDTIFNNLR